MPKIKSKYCIQYYDLNGLLLSEEYLPCSQAISKFVMCCSLGVELSFTDCKDIRLLSGSHVMFQFRDVRKVVNQSQLFPL